MANRPITLSIKDIMHDYRVSRSTAYKYVQRFEAAGGKSHRDCGVHRVYSRDFDEWYFEGMPEKIERETMGDGKVLDFLTYRQKALRYK